MAVPIFGSEMGLLRIWDIFDFVTVNKTRNALDMISANIKKKRRLYKSIMLDFSHRL